jgi:hypothetical protein
MNANFINEFVYARRKKWTRISQIATNWFVELISQTKLSFEFV